MDKLAVSYSLEKIGYVQEHSPGVFSCVEFLRGGYNYSENLMLCEMLSPETELLL